MNPERKKLWVDALRSGEYHQTIGTLTRRSHGVESHCCLGVACQVAIKNGLDLLVVSEPVPESGNECIIQYGIYGETAALPSEVVLWFDLPSDNPSVKIQVGSYTDRSSLASINDSGASFDKIADYIEEQL